jgi:hypothetical protein
MRTYSIPDYELKPIPSLDGCFADSLGLVWREDADAGIFRPLNIVPGRYPRVVIDGIDHRVHRLVAMAFHGTPASELTCCRHLNDISIDNRPCNLAWGTEADNEADYQRLNGICRFGWKVRDPAPVIKLIREGVPYRDIPALTGVPLRTVMNIRARHCPDVKRPMGRPKGSRNKPK